MADHVVDGLFRVAARSRHARPEILEHVAAHPRVVTFPGEHALLHQVRREELGERGGHRLHEASLPHELDVTVAGEADPGEHRPTARDLVAIEAHPRGQPEPELEPAVLGVVVLDAVDPHAPERRVVGLRQNDRVLDRDPRLVVVPVEHPLLELNLGELAVVHERVIAMVVVVAALALSPDPFDEIISRQGRALGHSVISIPS